MRAVKPTGSRAAALKYDLLTAVGAYGLAGGKMGHVRALRFLTLLTARYNWARDELAIGQREIARLWNVDERTVKREMAAFRTLGWLVLRRQGARGRVSEYGLDLDRILKDTQAHWPSVGPDFDLRMAETHDAPTDKVVPLQPRGPTQAIPIRDDGTEWSLAQAVLQGADAALFSAWFQALARTGREGGRLVLSAPSRFHASYVMTHYQALLESACRDIDPTVAEVAVRA
ncbi:DnaA N-terminal domain-containing protein [Chachezhania sediminis]|uniref:DnaA N-terminal domain-containing protein n=1 Tax=Chachezhania sediminis TaxID=2599291 RepID=UPI00131B16E2|nr:DnaA N-terminal domain-containing protein [Chachezhania sediminis]